MILLVRIDYRILHTTAMGVFIDETFDRACDKGDLHAQNGLTLAHMIGSYGAYDIDYRTESSNDR
jgi:hypothetical protein